MSMTKKRIVILGAGYAGIFLSTNLSSKLDKYTTEIILVDRNNYHQLMQEIHLVASGYRTAEQLKIPISSLIQGKNINFIQGDIEKILPDKNTILLKSGELKYDELIVCLGSSTKYFNIPGADKYTLPLRSIYDASIIHNHILRIIDEAENKKHNIVIVGAGATGISLGSALAETINASPNKSNIKINIIEATSTILPGWDIRVKNKTEEILKEKGIRIFHNSLVERVDQNTLFLKDGLEIKSSLIIWTAGVRGYNIDIEPAIDKTNDGRIIVNEYCQTNQYKNIYSIGDLAAMKDSKGKLYPPLAQIAVRQARYLADSIAERYIHGTNPKEKFDYEIKAQIISVGSDEYVGLLNNYLVSGDLAKVIDEFTKQTYMKSLKSGGKNISVNLYENDFFSKVMAGITFAGFTFFKGLEKLA
ncbi:NADH dehydrogenase-like protein [Candidatus Nitrosocosmicus franklandus]|uniref:NADH dehydrogenase-like protein n=2 Tax=Candidatus Nitrosocosmicus franklandianus TaxID=1798806 RepID=A0A484I9A0_9ARCH|nr:NADH dehydrogenase-like protein [Candidatus Nitrosocosmicus franklandus]